MESLSFDLNIALKGFMAEIEASIPKDKQGRITNRADVNNLFQRVERDMADWEKRGHA